MEHIEYCVRVNGKLCHSTFDKVDAINERDRLAAKYPENVYDIVTNVYSDDEYNDLFINTVARPASTTGDFDFTSLLGKEGAI